MEIADKVVIITGGVGGMGLETTKALLDGGAKVGTPDPRRFKRALT